MAISTTELTQYDRFIGFMAFTGCYVCIASLTFGLPLSLIFFPKSIGMFVALPYYAYTLTIGKHESRDGAMIPGFSNNPIFRAMRRLLQMSAAPLPRELAEAEKKQGAQFLIAMYPHGVWADYYASMDGLWPKVFPNIYPKIRNLTASVLFRVPIIREIGVWTGAIEASRHVAGAALDRGRTIMVKPGGEAEQLRTTRGREIVYLKKRKGFLRLAMSKNVPVVPCYIFGASDYHHTWSGLFQSREWIQKRFGVCIPISVGYWGSLCPIPVRTTVVFGKPLEVEVKEEGNPTTEEIDAAHAQFCDALVSLFDEHKGELGYGDRKLEIV